MGIKEDAGNLLGYIYNEYIKGNTITANDVLQGTEWGGIRADIAVKYLRDIGAIKIDFFLGNLNGLQNFFISGLTPVGIEIIENKSKFKNTFGVELNLAILKFNFSKTEK